MADVNCEFGALTLAGAAGVTVTGTSISSGDASGHWQISGGKISPSATGDSANLNAGPYSLTLNNAQTVDITIVANARSVNSFVALEVAAESMSLGQKILCRAGGDYSGGREIRPTQLVGQSFTTPTNKDGVYYRGPDLDTGNYLHIKNHTGETLVFTSQLVIKAGAYLRFSNIYWDYSNNDIGRETPPDLAAMINIDGSPWCALDNCTFQCPSSETYGDTERRCGIYALTGGGEGLAVVDCTFNDVWRSIYMTALHPTVAHDFAFIGNTVRNSWKDTVRPAAGDRQRYCWNFLIDKKEPDTALELHPDFIQVRPNWSRNYSDIYFIGNVIARGAGRGTQMDGQGIFLDDLNDPYYWDGTVVVGNRMSISYANGIFVGQSVKKSQVSPSSVNSFIRNNTLLGDAFKDNANTIITLPGGSTGTDKKYNIDNSTGDATNTGCSRYADYVFFAGGDTEGGNFNDAAIGSTWSAVNANFDIVASSAPDLESPKHGAHQDYIDYANRWLDLPYTLPNGEGQEGTGGTPAAPNITGTPSIIGTEVVGQTLTAIPASVTGSPIPTRTWQWYNSVSGAIAGATSSTYTLQASDEGDTIYVIQTETNTTDPFTDTAQSANTGTIAAAGSEGDPPAPLSFSPADNATSVSVASPLVLTFDMNIQFGSSGTITLWRAGAARETWLVANDPNTAHSATIDGAALTLVTQNNMRTDAAYSIHIDAGAIESTTGVAYAGFSDDTTWNWTTGAASPPPTQRTGLSLPGGALHLNGVILTLN